MNLPFPKFHQCPASVWRVAFHLDVGTGATLIAAATTLLVALLILVLDVESRVHRAFALFLFLRGLLDGSLAFTSQVDDLAGRLRVYLFIALPFAAAHFAYAYRLRHGGAIRRRMLGGRWAVPLVLLAVALCVEAVYLLDHHFFIEPDPSGPDKAGPLSIFTFLPAVSYAAIALLFALGARQEEKTQHGKALILASLAFALEPLFYSSFRGFDLVLDTLRGDDESSWYPTVEAGAYVLALATIVVMAAILYGVKVNRRDIRLRAIPLLGTSLLTGVLCAVLFASARFSDDLAVAATQTIRAFWLLFLPVLVTYALVKHRLFDVEVRLRFAIKGTTLAAIFLAVFFVVNKVTENVVAESFGGGNRGVYVGGAVAGLLLFALAPLQRLADRIAQKAVPVGKSALDREERARLFREQLEIAWGDGRLTAKERLLFSRLQERLGIPAEEAARLETDVVAKLQRGNRVSSA